MINIDVMSFDALFRKHYGLFRYRIAKFKLPDRKLERDEKYVSENGINYSKTKI